MSEALFWLADNVVVWRPLAIALLVLLLVGCVHLVLASWGR